MSQVRGVVRSGLESLFEHVAVTTDARQAPAGALLCTVRFIAAGLAMAPGGQTMVGTLEWSVTLTRQGQPETIYSRDERTVGTREGAGAFGSFDPAPVGRAFVVRFSSSPATLWMERKKRKDRQGRSWSWA